MLSKDLWNSLKKPESQPELKMVKNFDELPEEVKKAYELLKVDFHKKSYFWVDQLIIKFKDFIESYYIKNKNELISCYLKFPEKSQLNKNLKAEMEMHLEGSCGSVARYSKALGCIKEQFNTSVTLLRFQVKNFGVIHTDILELLSLVNKRFVDINNLERKLKEQENIFKIMKEAINDPISHYQIHITNTVAKIYEYYADLRDVESKLDNLNERELEVIQGKVIGLKMLIQNVSHSQDLLSSQSLSKAKKEVEKNYLKLQIYYKNYEDQLTKLSNTLQNYVNLDKNLFESGQLKHNTTVLHFFINTFIVPYKDTCEENLMQLKAFRSLVNQYEELRSKISELEDNLMFSKTENDELCMDDIGNSSEENNFYSRP